jgi:adenylate kinase family enzyme
MWGHPFEMITLQDLGKRISIIGPSNSGKSTLAQSLAKKLDIPVCHLDQLAHIPGTNWQPRSNEEWKAEHDLFISNSIWVIDGNYSFCMPQRFARSTYVIWLDLNIWGCVRRYLLRSLKSEPNRPGRLINAKRDFNIGLIRYMMFTYPGKRKKAKVILEQSGVPLLHLCSIKELNRHYEFWGLKR